MAIDKERKYKRVTKGLFDDEPGTGGKKVRGLYTVNPEERRDFYEQHKEQQKEREQTLARNREIMTQSYDRFRSDPFGKITNVSPAEKVRVSKAYYDSHPITRMAVRTTNKLIADVNRRNAALDSRSELSFEEKMAEADRLERSSTTNINGNTFAVTPRTDRHGIDVSRYNSVYESPQAEAKALRRYAYETASEPELRDLEKRMQSGEYADTHKTDAALSMIGDIEQTYGKQKADMIRDVFYGGRRYDDVDPYTGRTVGDLIEDGMSLDDIDRVNAFYDRKTGTVNSFSVDSFGPEDVRAGLDFVRARDLESKKDRESAYFDDVLGQIQSDPRAPYLGYYANRYEDDTTGMGEVAEYVQLLLSEFGGDRGEENFKSKTTIQNLAGEVNWKVSRPDVNIPFMGVDTAMHRSGALNGVAIDQDDLDWITEDEARKLLTLYNSDPKNGPQLALRYLRLISYDLKNRHDNRYTEYVGRINRRLDEIGPVAGAAGRIIESGASVAMAPAAGVEGLMLIPAMVAGINLNDYEYAGIISDVQRGIRQSINEDIDSSMGRFLYNSGMSMLDNVANMAAASGFGAESATGFKTLVKDSEKVVLAVMSASAGVPAYKDALDRGLSTGQATALALSAVFAEYITEKVSVDRFLKSPKNVLLSMARNAVPEALEEGASSILNAIADNIIAGGDSELKQKTRQYMVMYGIGENEAFSRAFSEWVQETGEEMLSGALSGLMFGIIGAFSQPVQDTKSGSYLNRVAGINNNNAAKGTVAYEAGKAVNAAGLNALGQEVIDRYGKNSYEGKRAAKAIKAGNEGKTSERAKGELTRYIVDDMVEKGEAANADEAYNAVVSAHQMRSIYEGMRQSRRIDASAQIESPDFKAMYEQRTGNRLEGSETENLAAVEEYERKLSNRRNERTEYKLANVRGVDAVDPFGEGDLALDTVDGTIHADDLDFGDADKVIVDAVRKADAVTGTELIKSYNQLVSEGRTFDADSAAEFVKRFNDVNAMGRQGVFANEDAAVAALDGYAGVIGADAVRWAYRTGAQYTARDTAARQSAPVYAEAPVFEGKIAPKSLHGEYQRTGQEASDITTVFKDAVEKVKVNGKFASMTENGRILPALATIEIADDADGAFTTLIHEFSHLGDLRDAKRMQPVRDALIKWYAKKYGAAALEEVIENYRRHYSAEEGAAYTRSKALDEVIADAMGGIFATKEGRTDFLSWLYRENPKSVADKVVNWFIDFLNRIADVFHSFVEQDVKDGSLNELQKQFYEMAKENETLAHQIRQEFLSALDDTTETAARAEQTQVSESNETKRQSRSDPLGENKLDVNSPAFKEWFGDSKVVNPDGTPKIVYHGTGANFNVFEYGHKRKSGKYIKNFGEGHYFTDKRSFAENYTEDDFGNKGRVIEAYLSLKNPYTGRFGHAFDTADYLAIQKMMPARFDKVDAANVNEALRSLGYDGIVSYSYDGKSVDTYIAFESTQIKSATDNIGTFDRNDPDIRRQSRSDPLEPDKLDREAVDKYVRKLLADQEIVHDIDLAMQKEEIEAVLKEKYNLKKEQREKILKDIYNAKQLARDEARKEREAKTALRQSIRQGVSDLVTMLNHPTKKRYVPRNFIESVVSLLEYVDDVTSYRLTDADAAEINAKFAAGVKAGSTYTSLYDSLAEEYGVTPTTVKRVIEGRGQADKGSSLKTLIDKLNKQYKSLKGDKTYAPLFNTFKGLDEDGNPVDRVKGWIDFIGRAETAQSMSYRQLEALRNLVQYVRSQVVNAVSAKAFSDQMNAVELGERVMEDVQKAEWFATNRLNKILQPFASPENAFDALGGYRKGNVFRELYRGLNRASHKEMAFVHSAYDSFADVLDFSDKDNRENYKKLQSTDEDDMINMDFVDKDGKRIAMTDKEGNVVKLTHGVAASLYAQLGIKDNRRHIAVTGFYVPGYKAHYGSKKGRGFTENVATRVFGRSAAYLERAEEVRQHYNELVDQGATDEELQWYLQNSGLDIAAEEAYWDRLRTELGKQLTDYDMRFIEAAKRFFNGMSKDALNEMSRNMWGFDVARVEDYWPIISDPKYLGVSDEQIAKDVSFENAGNLQERKFGTNPIQMWDIGELMHKQIRQIARQYAYTEPVAQLNKVLSVRKAMSKESVQSLLEEKFHGPEALERIQQLVRDATGRNNAALDEMDGLMRLLDKARGNLAQATLSSLNIGVMFGQAGSYPTAMAVVGPKPLLKALAVNPDQAEKGQKGHGKIGFWRANEQLINKYSELYRYRSSGNPATGFENAANKPALAQRNKFTRIMFGGIGAFDRMTVGRLWYAAEYYVNDKFVDLYKNKNKSEADTDAYYKKVGEVFDEIIERTQPNYTAMQRPSALRSKNPLAKSLFMFKTQIAQNYNLMYGSVMRAMAAQSEYDKSKTAENKAALKEARLDVAKSISGVLSGQAAYRVFKTLAAALLAGFILSDDDDEEASAFERAVKDALANYPKDLIGNFMILSNVVEAVDKVAQGQKIDAVFSLFGMDQINDILADGIKAIHDLTEGEVSAKQLEKLFINGSAAAGIPARDARKWALAFQKWTGIAGSDEYDLTKPQGILAYSIAGNMDYDTAVQMATEVQTAKVEANYPGATAKEIQKKVDTAVRDATTNALKAAFLDAYEDGDFEKCEEIKAYMVENEIYDDAGVKTLEWINDYKDKKRMAGEELTGKMTDSEEAKLTAPDTALGKLKAAVESGEGVKEAVKELYDEMIDAEDGYVSQKRKKEIRQEIKDKINGKLIDMFQRAYYYGDKTEMERVRGVMRDTELYDDVRDTSVGWAENWESYTEDTKREKIKKWEDN